jgi:hypothetical protein
MAAAPPYTLQNFCAERGISADVAGRLGWHVDGHYLRMPVRDLAGNLRQIRRKNLRHATHKHEAKYDTSKRPGDPQDVGYKFFHAPELRQAIADAGGCLLIANGEPAAAAMLSAGIANACSIGFGEGIIPADLIEWLTGLGVTSVLYCPDRDNQGARGATRLRDALANSGIAFDCRALPDTLADKADLDDLWQAAGFDADVFAAELQNLAPFTDWTPTARHTEAAPDRQYANTNAADHYAEWQAELRQAVETNRKSRRVGRITYYRCPVHEDDHPSFRFLPSGAPVCSCDIHRETNPYAIIAEAIGFPDFRTWRDERYPRWPASTNGTPSARRHVATSGTTAPRAERSARGNTTETRAPEMTPENKHIRAVSVDELEREHAFIFDYFSTPTTKPALAAVAAPVETPWILTPYDVAGLRRYLRCNADTADIARDLLEAAAAGRLPEAFTVYQAADVIGVDEQTARRILTRIGEYFSVSARRDSLRTQTEKNSPGQPARLYTLPRREHVETVIAPFVDAALVQAYCPTVAPLTHDRARRMYEDDTPADQLDELAARLTAARPNDATAERSAHRRLQVARKMAAEIAIPLTVATATNPADRQQERDSLALELANEQPIGVRGAAAVLGCSVGKVHRRAAAVGYVYHPEENWIDVTGPGAWQDAKKAARELGGVLKEVERSASRRKVGVHKHDLQLATGQTARVLIVSKGRFLHNPTAARARLQELDKKPALAAVAAPVEQPTEPTPRAERRANRYGWTYRTRLQNLEARIPLADADGRERTPFLTIAEAIAAILAAPVDTLTARPKTRSRRSKAEISYDGPIIGAPASSQEPPTADELPLLEAPPAEHDYGTPYIEDAAPISPAGLQVDRLAAADPLIALARSYGAVVTRVS